METREFEVEVVYRQRALYRVHAADRQEAERIAAGRWQQGGEGEAPGDRGSELEAVYAQEVPDEAQGRQDAELVLRYLQERERLVLRLGAAAQPPENDAVSAGQVAADLGWRREPPGDGAAPDTMRAAAALERLCAQRRVVCFERPRVRAGERGEVRLYCTPGYLDRLTASTLESQAV